MPTTASRFHPKLLRLPITLLAFSGGFGPQAGELPAAQIFNFANVDGIREHGVTVSTGESRRVVGLSGTDHLVLEPAHHT